jgi:hypothetical protein
MKKTKTVQETIVAIFGDEFPIIERMSPTVFKHFFGCWPKTAIDKMTLAHTYKVSEYVKDDHATVVDCIIATAGIGKE